MSIGLNTGLSALLSSQLALDTIGHNIANANTEGYSRQSVDLHGIRPQLARGLLVGAGVGADDVHRTVDDLLQRRILQQVSSTYRLGTQLAGMSEVEALFSEPGGFGLGSLMDNFFQSVSSLSGAPQDPILRTGVAQAGLEMAAQFHSLSQSLTTLESDAATQLKSRVQEVNEIAKNLARLNLDIHELESGGLTANDLRDQRDVALRDLGELVDFTTQEASAGAITVLVGGNMLVSPTKSYGLAATTKPDGDLAVKISGAQGFVPVTGGAIGGLLRLSDDFLPGVSSELDALARNMILGLNRAHSTGIPASGPFTLLVADNAVADADGDGLVTDERLQDLGLPFEIQNGELYVNVTEQATGQTQQHKLAIDPANTTLGDLLDGLNAIPQLSAGIDGLGRLSLSTDAGYGFDFSKRLDTQPDDAGTFGGAAATLSTSAAGPFALADGDTLDLDVLPGPASVSITLDAGDFDAIATASAEELAAVINADAGAQAAGLQATAVDGRLVVQTVGTGAAAGFTVAGGSALGALGWSGVTGTTITGQDTAVDVQIGGSYQGATNELFTFVPTGDGVIGTTPGLSVEVYDQSGKLLSSVNVGAGYQPGSPIELGNGLTASFSLGELSSTAGDFFELDAPADGDSSDVLVAFGLNSFLTGTSAATLAVRAELVVDNSKIASSLTGSDGDNGALLELLDVEGLAMPELDGQSLGQRYGQMIGELGFDVASTQSSLAAGESLLGSLDLRRESVSGVNVDEELVDLIRFEQSFQAASEYINVVNRLHDELLQIL